eukprot:6465505-Amphidinium_carterae.1
MEEFRRLHEDLDAQVRILAQKKLRRPRNFGTLTLHEFPIVPPIRGCDRRGSYCFDPLQVPNFLEEQANRTLCGQMEVTKTWHFSLCQIISAEGGRAFLLVTGVCEVVVRRADGGCFHGHFNASLLENSDVQHTVRPLACSSRQEEDMTLDTWLNDSFASALRPSSAKVLQGLRKQGIYTLEQLKGTPEESLRRLSEIG